MFSVTCGYTFFAGYPCPRVVYSTYTPLDRICVRLTVYVIHFLQNRMLHTCHGYVGYCDTTSNKSLTVRYRVSVTCTSYAYTWYVFVDLFVTYNLYYIPWKGVHAVTHKQ